MSRKHIIIAIDGPAGAGKSTLARRIAAKLGFLHINTGAMYRAVALWALRLEIDLTDMHKLEQLALEAQIVLDPRTGRITLNGEDVTEMIRTPQVSAAASQVSVVPGVRRALLGLQRQMAGQGSVVMEGRDIGSVVFPQAQVKIFLDADPAERARRRALELAADHAAIAGELHSRDLRDRQRPDSPLVQAPDAELVDTTGLSAEQVEDEVLRIIRARTSNGKAAAV